ncbi:sigma-54-dependent Fis family transcriptional regulator [Azospira restricta]|uniref:Sigma-54-dependent Fis family transcriptional regulator n=1 Tax=Azospira restricta TaxID=404405 RepID=A0A974SN98_9RHOO|nr:sigma-54-dependent Fis family transcriptional regulator [Azospira restricta]QRJ63084.1 sigma-54-dependent Fis family transcriptional regulator [Azospira restricta]
MKNEDDELPAPAGDASDLIARSWQRCRDAGLDAAQALPVPATPPKTLADRLEANARLVAYAQPMLEGLYQHLARSSSMVLLADNAGMILRAVGDADFIARAARCHLQPGAVWSEAEMGTNAIGTALVERCTVAVVGREHFLDRNRFLTCISAPILAPGGGVLGVLDISGDARVAQVHGAALVEINAGIIENRLLETLPDAAVVLRLHATAEGLGSHLDGLLALADDGRCLAGNRRLPRLFGRPAGWSPAGAGFAELFATPWPALLEHACRRGEEPLAVRLRHGGELLARIGLRAGVRSFAVAAPPAAPARCPLDELGSEDPRMAEAIRRAKRIAECDIPLLIQGETGSGKEWFAQAFHKSGARRAAPFVAVNCAAIPATLIEAELFGHVEGAFTGARRSGARGKIREADGGTLFLDEIGDMPLALQAVLLRVLETRRVAPLGGHGEEPVDFALVCASHQPLRALVDHGQFRADLFFRLSGMTVSLPPLRERQDFDRVVRRILAEEAPGREPRVAPAALDLLRRHDWPGNLRQLRNVLRLAVALLGDERLLTPDFLPAELLDAGCRGHGESGLRAVQIRLVQETVERHGGNISAAARELGITRTTLYRKLAEGRGERGAAPDGGGAGGG